MLPGTLHLNRNRVAELVHVVQQLSVWRRLGAIDQENGKAKILGVIGDVCVVLFAVNVPGPAVLLVGVHILLVAEECVTETSVASSDDSDRPDSVSNSI